MASFDNFSFLDNLSVGTDSLNLNFSKPIKPSSDFNQSESENFNFNFAPINDPSSFCDNVKKSNGEERKIMNFKKGTTTLGIFLESKL